MEFTGIIAKDFFSIVEEDCIPVAIPCKGSPCGDAFFRAHLVENEPLSFSENQMIRAITAIVLIREAYVSAIEQLGHTGEPA